jgi:hypothetical protein
MTCGFEIISIVQTAQPIDYQKKHLSITKTPNSFKDERAATRQKERIEKTLNERC